MAIRVWLFSLALCALRLAADENDALVISQTIQDRHLPFGTVLDPSFDTPDGMTITGYTRCGDSALWTGMYLAAESYRYAASKDPAALDNVRKALAGIKSLVDVTGTDVLARCLVPAGSPYASGIVSEEAGNGVYAATLDGRTHYWIGNTSRDQYAGVFFGLSVAHELIGDDVRDSARALITRLTDYLRYSNWSPRMPDGSASTTFVGRPDQQLSILQAARRANPDRFTTEYHLLSFAEAFTVSLPIDIDAINVYSSYFKFNLDYLFLFNLLRLDMGSSYHGIYDGAYKALRRATQDHQNAHFNMIDRALHGAEPYRDAQTPVLLNAWLMRPRRDVQVDLRSQFAVCGDNQSCTVIPTEWRVTTDFLWQRSPFQLTGGGVGLTEGAGIDYILPYWMARYYKVVSR